MKRYWKLITITTVVVLTFATLYIQASFANSKYPEFVIEHKSGNQEEVEPLTIIGGYAADEANFIGKEISDQGTSYQNNQSSYLYFLQGDYLPAEIKRLQKDYRNFMRGKHEQIELFFEDQNVLAYVERKSEYLSTRDRQWSYSFEVDVLDQKSKNKTKFELAIPEGEKYAYLDIHGVQFINDELKITTVNELNTNTEQSYNREMHIYTVDIETQKVVSDDAIDVITNQLETTQWLDMYTINNEAYIGPNNYFVFLVEKNEETILEDGYGQQTLERQYIVYNLETSEQESIELPEEYEGAYPELLSGTTIYFSKETENQIEIMTYNLENQQIETKQIFDLPNIEEQSLKFFTLTNDKIYIVSQLDEGKVDSSIMIGDVLTGKVLYEGSIKDQQVNQMHISHLSVKKE